MTNLSLLLNAFPKRRIGLIGAIEGKADIVGKLIQHMQASNVETFYWFGNHSLQRYGR